MGDSQKDALRVDFDRTIKLEFHGAIRLVGTVCRRAGRPEHVYCRYRPKPA